MKKLMNLKMVGVFSLSFAIFALSGHATARPIFIQNQTLRDVVYSRVTYDGQSHTTSVAGWIQLPAGSGHNFDSDKDFAIYAEFLDNGQRVILTPGPLRVVGYLTHPNDFELRTSDFNPQLGLSVWMNHQPIGTFSVSSVMQMGFSLLNYDQYTTENLIIIQ